MYTISGSGYDYIRVFADRIKVHTEKKNWFDGSKSSTTVTFAKEDIFDVVLVKPKLFKRGWISFIFNEDSSVSMKVPYSKRNPVESLYHLLKNNL